MSRIPPNEIIPKVFLNKLKQMTYYNLILTHFKPISPHNVTSRLIDNPNQLTGLYRRETLAQTGLSLLLALLSFLFRLSMMTVLENVPFRKYL